MASSVRLTRSTRPEPSSSWYPTGAWSNRSRKAASATASSAFFFETVRTQAQATPPTSARAANITSVARGVHQGAALSRTTSLGARGSSRNVCGGSARKPVDPRDGELAALAQLAQRRSARETFQRGPEDQVAALDDQELLCRADHLAQQASAHAYELGLVRAVEGVLLGHVTHQRRRAASDLPEDGAAQDGFDRRGHGEARHVDAIAGLDGCGLLRLDAHPARGVLDVERAAGSLGGDQALHADPVRVRLVGRELQHRFERSRGSGERIGRRTHDLDRARVTARQPDAPELGCRRRNGSAVAHDPDLRVDEALRVAGLEVPELHPHRPAGHGHVQRQDGLLGLDQARPLHDAGDLDPLAVVAAARQLRVRVTARHRQRGLPDDPDLAGHHVRGELAAHGEAVDLDEIARMERLSQPLRAAEGDVLSQLPVVDVEVDEGQLVEVRDHRSQVDGILRLRLPGRQPSDGADAVER